MHGGVAVKGNWKGWHSRRMESKVYSVGYQLLLRLHLSLSLSLYLYA